MARIPGKQEVRDWIAENPGESARRDIARAFGLKGAERIELKHILKELEAEGLVLRDRRRLRDSDSLPEVAIVQILPPDRSGDQFARPVEWQGAGPEPRILFVAHRTDAPVAEGDRVLAKLVEVRAEDHRYEARLIRRLGTNPVRILGLYRTEAEGGRIVPVDKGSDKEWRVAAGDSAGARDGELVEAELAGPRVRLGLPRARVIERLGDPSAPRAVSLIAIHQHAIPDHFSDAAIAEADAMLPAPVGTREDLRDLSFCTIDPADARDRDDACLAMPDPDPANPGGHVLWVAIADVAAYVRPGSALDRDARQRGNSTYFPDRVVPMLPERLSGDLCSLHEGVDRPVIAVRMVLDRDGNKTGHRFARAMIRSVAGFAYEEVQAARDGRPDGRAAALLDPVIAPLYAAYEVLKSARERRQPLDLDLPERRIELSAEGRVTSVAFRERFDAHRLIEEFMILANVAAAEELIRLRRPLLFRVHEEPTPLKLEALREVAEASGFTLAKGQVLQTRHLNRLLAQAQGTQFDELMNMTTLRSLPQAYYNPENFGHFGLALRNYAHFTSPIRRYSDLIVHRALILAHGWGKDGLSTQDIETLEETARLVSESERRSMAAERDTTDRYLAAYLSERAGREFAGRISGVTRFGLFVRLEETGADGLIPIRTLGREYFRFDAQAQTLTGADSGHVLGIGQKVLVRLAEAVPVTGGLTLELLEVEGEGLPGGPSARRGKRVMHKPGAARAKAAKLKRKLERRRRH
jgi:ribonuclease R